MNDVIAARELVAAVKLIAGNGLYYDTADAVMGDKIQIGRSFEMISKHVQKLVDTMDMIDTQGDSGGVIFSSDVQLAMGEVKFVEREIPRLRSLIDTMEKSLAKTKKVIENIEAV